MISKLKTATGKRIPTNNPTKNHVLSVICSFPSGICLFDFLSFSLMMFEFSCCIPVVFVEGSVVDLLFDKKTTYNQFIIFKEVFKYPVKLLFA